MQDPDSMVNTGFIMSTSKNEVWEEQVFLRRTQIIANENVNLFFKRVQDRYDNGTVVTKISGMIYRTYSSMDLQELKRISEAVKQNQKIPEIDMTSIVSNYSGHTIFSIF